jgi:small subunit ribosomal protein S13
MVLIGKHTLNEKDKVHTAFGTLYGIGGSKKVVMTKILGMRMNNKLSQVEKEDLEMFTDTVLNVDLEVKYPLLQWNNRLIRSGGYRQRRKNQSLPCRGQRTHTNAKTTKTLKKLGKDVPMKIQEATYVLKARERYAKLRAEADKKRMKRGKGKGMKGKGKAKGKGAAKGKKKKK